MSKILCAVYVVCGFLTFGHTYNHYDCGGWTEERCKLDRDPAAAMKGLAWPAYWAGRAALEVTK